MRAHGGPAGAASRYFAVSSLEAGERVSYDLPLDGPSPSLVFSWEDELGQAGALSLDGEQQAEARATLLEPGVVAAVELEQHPRARHALAPHAVLWRAAPPRAGHAGPRQDAPHRGAAEGEAFVLLKQLGEVGVVGARVPRGGEAHDSSRDGLGDADVQLGLACGGRALPHQSVDSY